MGSGDFEVGEDSIDEVSGEVRGVVRLEGEPESEALLPVVIDAALEVVEDLLLG